MQAQCENLSGNELTRKSSGNTLSQSSQLAEPLWTDPGLKTGISVRELSPTTTTKPQAGNELSNILPKSSHARKKSHQCCEASLTECGLVCGGRLTARPVVCVNVVSREPGSRDSLLVRAPDS